jgi:aminoglycoside phosphotransferase (APT) family kinase protein
MEPAGPRRRLLVQREVETMTDPMRPHILDEQPKVASSRLPSEPVELRGPELQPRQDMPIRPDFATAPFEFKPAKVLCAVLLLKRIEVFEDRRKNDAGFELDVNAVDGEARTLAEFFVADRSDPDTVAIQVCQALFERLDHELLAAGPRHPPTSRRGAWDFGGIFLCTHCRGASSSAFRIHTPVWRRIVEVMGQFVAGGGNSPDLAGDVTVERRLGTAIKEVRGLPAPDSTSYALGRVALDLADGRTLDVLVKDFDVSPHAPDTALARGGRERYVYEKLLAGRGLGTPELYGVVWDESSGRHWLLLEFVHGKLLRHCPIEDWIAAAGWLARLHGSIACHEAELGQSGHLVNYDDAYFRGMAERALKAVGSRSGTLHRRLEAAVAGYETMIEKICGGRQTLVHGSYRPKNIIVDTRSTPVRVCPVDWELAAVGPALHDLACIANEVDLSTIEQVCNAYADGAAAVGLTVTGTDKMLVEIERLRLHRVLRSLARSVEWAYPDSAVAVLVAKAEEVRRGMG